MCLRSQGWKQEAHSALGHHVRSDDTCWPDKQGSENGRRLRDPSSCPLAGLMVAKGKTQPHLPSETAAGKCLCRHREKHEVQPLRHWDANRIWEYLCLGGIAPAKGKENSNCGVQRAQSLIICFSITWRAAERRGRETPSSPPSGSSLT